MFTKVNAYRRTETHAKINYELVSPSFVRYTIFHCRPLCVYLYIFGICMWHDSWQPLNEITNISEKCMCFGISPFPTVYQFPNRIFHFYSHRSPISVHYQSNMGKKAQKVKLTPTMWNELRILCALRGYSSMKQGKGKTVMQRHDTMYHVMIMVVG